MQIPEVGKERIEVGDFPTLYAVKSTEESKLTSTDSKATIHFIIPYYEIGTALQDQIKEIAPNSFNFKNRDEGRDNEFNQWFYTAVHVTDLDKIKTRFKVEFVPDFDTGLARYHADLDVARKAAQSKNQAEAERIAKRQEQERTAAEELARETERGVILDRFAATIGHPGGAWTGKLPEGQGTREEQLATFARRLGLTNDDLEQPQPTKRGFTKYY